MIKKLIKLFLCCAISISFAQDNKYINLNIDGLHCAAGCARYVQTELNKNIISYQNAELYIKFI